MRRWTSPRLLDSLNPAQREAVAAPPAPTLVLAGAGSGKTRVLVHRIAWLIEVEGIAPWGLLAVTFTNKAANEMRGRIETLLGQPVSGLWVGTFHGLAHRLLRQHWQEAKLPQGFQILDSDDQLRLIRRVLRALEMDEARWPPRQAQWFINARKDEGRRPESLPDSGDPISRQWVRAYTAYEQACTRAGVVDFAELLLRALELLRDNEELLTHYRNRFRHLLVDEFQDTNDIQYAWLRLLAGAGAPLFAVGDDDQSIYGWRGARIENLQHFQKDFPGTQVLRLEQNYRSSANILNAANALIRHNQGRMGKELWTEGHDGAPVRLFAAINEQDEARFVAETIARHVEHGGLYGECAVLYRSNAQSRVLEETFIARRMPYRVYGGLRFFERQEVRDALAYLRLAGNSDDDAAFLRVVNQPPRGIGEKTLDELRQLAQREDSSLYWAAVQAVQDGLLAGRARNAVAGFLQLLAQLADETDARPLPDQVERTIERSGLREHYANEKGERGQARLENLDELIGAARAFEQELPPDAEAACRRAHRVPGPRRARGRRGGRRSPRGCGADDDPALGEGPGVSAGLPGRPGGGPVSERPLAGGAGPPGGGTPAGLCRHDPGRARTLPDLRREPAPVRARVLQHAVAVHPRAAGGDGRGPAPAGPKPPRRPLREPPARLRPEPAAGRSGGGGPRHRCARAPCEIRRGGDHPVRGRRRLGPGPGPLRQRRRQVAGAQLRPPGATDLINPRRSSLRPR
jgi:DNA helicase II / ATP-dependent DNA helicase PcrA